MKTFWVRLRKKATIYRIECRIFIQNLVLEFSIKFVSIKIQKKMARNLLEKCMSPIKKNSINVENILSCTNKKKSWKIEKIPFKVRYAKL